MVYFSEIQDVFFQTQDFHGNTMESLSCSMRKSRGVPAMAMAGGRAWNDLPPRPPPPEDWGVDQWISHPKVGEILGFNHLTMVAQHSLTIKK